MITVIVFVVGFCVLGTCGDLLEMLFNGDFFMRRY